MVMGVSEEGDPTTMAVPRLVASLLMVVVVVSDELHVTEASCCMLPSLNVPVAMNCCVVRGDSMTVAGVTAIESRFAGVSVVGRYSSALARTGLLIL